MPLGSPKGEGLRPHSWSVGRGIGLICLKEMLTFGRIHDQIQALKIHPLGGTAVLLVPQVGVLTFGRTYCSPSGEGAHFREKERSPWGEEVLTFGRRTAHFREKKTPKN